MEDMNELFDKMVEEQAKACKNQKMESEKKAEEASKAKTLLANFKKYIQSESFDKKCKEQAEKHGIGDYTIVKNVFIRNTLKKIANILGITVTFTCDVVKYAVNFLSKLIQVVINFGASILHKLINLLTLNCGNQEQA